MESRGALRLAAVAGAAFVLGAGCAVFRGSSRRIALDESGVQYFSDLGPDHIDVSGYPPEQQRRYKTYAQVCARCHTLARSVNSPVVSRDFWELYVSAMRRRSDYGPDPAITKEQADDIVEFLEFDSRIRKEGNKQFNERVADLKKRYADLTEPGRKRL